MREPTSTSLDKSHMEELTFGLRRNRTLDIDKNFVCKLSHLEKVLGVLKCFLDMEEALELNFLSEHLQHESSETNFIAGAKGELASGVKRKICGESGSAKKYQATAIETQRGMISSGSAGEGSQGSVARAPRPPKPLQNLTSSFQMTIDPVSAFVSDSHVPPSPPMTSKPSRSLRLILDIPGDPEDIPRLRELLVAIGEKEGDLILRLRHDFRHPRDGGSVLEEAIMQVFQSATLRVTEFEGQLSGSALAALPSGLGWLRLAVKDDHHYQALLPALSSLPGRLPKLRVLGLHVAAGQDAALLRPLPDVEFLYLYVSGVKEAPVERTSRVVRALQSPRGYWEARLPWRVGVRGGVRSPRGATRPRGSPAEGGVWGSGCISPNRRRKSRAAGRPRQKGVGLSLSGVGRRRHLEETVRPEDCEARRL
ncbi:uncharacterized protein LOC122242968 isoform X2 [Penaeus japonicus]|uniref:uncharacterized protein LOC122242968 isoform X2 n=1 Tax=Penaeus japonicus TaxID=27405 RepID=UPI001C70C9D5|nr:uncharacterized protein LOC122242968 isoform X2 [Penaeus japonicus]